LEGPKECIQESKIMMRTGISEANLSLAGYFSMELPVISEAERYLGLPVCIGI
jgi:hypothetical protein